MRTSKNIFVYFSKVLLFDSSEEIRTLFLIGLVRSEEIQSFHFELICCFGGDKFKNN